MFEKIIFLSGMPRSGTSWLSQIFDSSPDVRFRLSPLFSYELKNFVTVDSPKTTWNLLFEKAYLANSEFMDQTYRRVAGEYPVFKFKASLPKFLVIKDTRFHNLTEKMLSLFPDMKMVGLVRNPCGAINSWLRAPKEFRPGNDPLHHWREGECKKEGSGDFWGFEDWKWVTRLFLKLERETPERFLLVQYEDIVLEPIRWAKAMFDFCDLKYNSQTKKFILESQTKHIDNEYAVFKKAGVKDKWKTQLSPIIIKEIYNELKSTDLKRFLK